MLTEKYQKLLDWLKETDGVAIAFSGGVDSTFLLAAAYQALGDRALAVIGRSPTYPEREYKDALRLAAQIGAPCEEVTTDELNKPEFNSNPPSRCFVCKNTLMSAVRKVAQKHGINCIIEGSNLDDVGDFRPGMDATKKLGVRSPLQELGFRKTEIRELSKKMNLPTWEKPSFACLSSRIPYGQSITLEKLARIEKAEDALRDLGLTQYRVRDHYPIARIEILPSSIPDIIQKNLRSQIVEKLKKAGYPYVCLDLEGYRTGSMNEVLDDETKEAVRL